MWKLPGVEFNVGYCLLSTKRTKRVVFMGMSQLSFISNWLWNMFACTGTLPGMLVDSPSELFIDISIYLNTSKICIGKLLEYHADFVSPVF